ncbi:hypothetical protein A0H81_03613 [Grifola frondosa]|uniref:Transcription initiation factor TFIID subunit 8 n=1 Tax=Grifola frondosa TaxID=5627 RepID=A0A1C7MKG8_GRIFR|nr:hypothetical protein A0H81_03613 [Grifola frondosa]
MSYYPSQAYGSYQAPYSSYPNQNYYPSQYPAQSAPGYSLYQQSQAKPSTPPPESHTAPELPALRHAGFDSAQPSALQRLESEVVALVEQLYQRAQEYANLANRPDAIAKDLLLACTEYGLESKELSRIKVRSKKRMRDPSEAEIVLLAPPSRSPSPELLSSDDEGAPVTVPATLRTLPHYVPPLPPKHTYLRTPLSPPKKAALPSLEKKLKNAALVQDSLKNLLLATEDNTGQEDAELLGATVNWEATTHPRKRWRLGY